jgi:hypothetical protein
MIELKTLLTKRSLIPKKPKKRFSFIHGVTNTKFERKIFGLGMLWLNLGCGGSVGRCGGSIWDVVAQLGDVVAQLGDVVAQLGDVVAQLRYVVAHLATWWFS